MIIAIANQKGGVGKTSTAINLSAGWALAGKRVLLLDLDPQGNSSLSFVHSESINGSVFELLTELNEPWENFVVKTKVKGLDIVPARISLAKLEAKLVGDFAAIFRLRDRFEQVRADYDVIFFDTPPTLGIIPAPVGRHSRIGRGRDCPTRISARPPRRRGIADFRGFFELTAADGKARGKGMLSESGALIDL